MNKYFISLIEIIILAAVARFSSKNILLFTGDESIVNLNYIFWGIIIVLSVLINFHLYIYFGSVLLLGIAFLAIYIHKIVRVITFVDTEYVMFFWMIFITLFIPIFVLLITKRVLYSAMGSEAPQGYIGNVGKIGNRGDSFFIESVGDRAYVLIVNGIETYFREVLDRNEIDYDGTVMQFNNNYLKDNLKRICNSKVFIDKLWNQAKTQRNNLRSCVYIDTADSSSNPREQKRYCVQNSSLSFNDANRIYTTPSILQSCIEDKDCNTNSDADNIIEENETLVNLLKITPVVTSPVSDTSLVELDENVVYYLFLRVKYWIRLILENNCEQDKQLRSKLKIQDIYKLSETKMGFVDDFREFQEDNHPIYTDDHKKERYVALNSINYLRLNNLLGRKFLQSNFQNDKYWQKNNIKTINRNPFDIIHRDPMWNWGTNIGDPCAQTTQTQNIPGRCDIAEHA